MYMGSLHVGSGFGYSCPDFVKVAQAYGIPTRSITNHAEMRATIRQVLAEPGPVVCDVVLDEQSRLTPRLEFGKPIEDQTPYLPRDEFLANMIVEPLRDEQGNA
jgi:acetolactate synthase-1/2/3 large subunit